MRPQVGISYLADYSLCEEKFTKFVKDIMPLYDKMLIKSKANVIKTLVHQFDPFGVTIVSIISESSIALHTYVEEKKITVDFYSCNPSSDIEDALVYLGELLETSNFVIISVPRGIEDK